jgi:enoyl-CoA hydratase/carnithine racemase
VAYTEITYDEHGHVGLITINRPEARNALTYTTYAEMEDAVRTTTARCLIVTGADPAFCSGDDVKQILSTTGDAPSAERAPLTPRLTPLADALLHTNVPIIAAVNGAAVGWGMELALMADIRVASENAKFGELFVKRGINCDAPGLGRLAQVVGRETAAELLFTGRIITADEALRLRLVSRVVPHGELMHTSMALAHEIANNPPLAVQRLKQGLREALDPDWHELGAWVTQSLIELFQTKDHREGVASFLERREPVFTGE